MKNRNLILILCLILMSCDNDDDNSSITEDKIIGRFVHQIPDCMVGQDSLLNCTEFVDFIDDTKVDILIGRGDIVRETTYVREGSKITLDKKNGLGSDVSFMLQNANTLKRIEDNTIWVKSD
ncbi:hypothetical protein ABW636_05390 [Aquimarina sp. 2201CG1-2-11]|uniref:hypothetical protein n=1 Tax=Aquimarina discodermiae TaxID=3231043 RepID=UPI0034635E93